MDVSITGRNLSINETQKEQIADQLTALVEKLRDRTSRVEVEFTANPAKGSPDDAIRCEITLRGKGPVVRASGEAADKMVALDAASDRLESQLRRAADRRKRNRDLRSVRDLVPEDFVANVDEPSHEVPTRNVAGVQVTGDGPLVVREKNFAAVPLTLEQALDEMELVGHDFFLFVDADSGKPSVVYRRKAYNYGVIRLDMQDM